MCTDHDASGGYLMRIIKVNGCLILHNVCSFLMTLWCEMGGCAFNTFSVSPSGTSSQFHTPHTPIPPTPHHHHKCYVYLLFSCSVRLICHIDFRFTYFALKISFHLLKYDRIGYDMIWYDMKWYDSIWYDRTNCS